MRNRVRTPVMLQMEAAECGAASLGIVLGYHGRYEPLGRLRTLCGVSREFGLDAQAYRTEPGDLVRLTMPVIVYWNFDHFIEVEGMARGRVYINDPACGRKTITAGEFDRSFTGIALAFTKGPGFLPGGSKAGVCRALRDRFCGHKTALLYVMLATLALVGASLPAAALPSVFIDRVVLGGMATWQRTLAWTAVAVTVWMGLLTWLQQRAFQRVEAGLALGTSGRFVWHLLRLPLNFYAQRQSGELAVRAAANETVAGLVAGELVTNVAGLFVAGLYVVLMLRFDVILTCIGAGIAC